MARPGMLKLPGFLRGSLGRGAAGDHKGPPIRPTPRSPLRTVDGAFQKPTSLLKNSSAKPISKGRWLASKAKSHLPLFELSV